MHFYIDSDSNFILVEENNIWSGMLKRNWCVCVCVSRGVRLVIYL